MFVPFVLFVDKPSCSRRYPSLRAIVSGRAGDCRSQRPRIAA
jgi:hypothetical protein